MEQMKSLFESIEKPIYTDDPWENFKRSPMWEIANGLPPKKAQPKTTTAVPETKTTKKPWFKKDLKEMTVADCVMSLKQLNMRILELPFDERRISIKEVIMKIKKETRLIYPKNKYKYVELQNGYEVPRKYDYLVLYCGNRKALVKVNMLETDIVEIVDDNGRQIWDTNWDGTRYARRMIEYSLGEIVRTDNLG